MAWGKTFMRAGRQALLGVDWGDGCLSLVAVDGHPAQGWRLSLSEQESWLGEPDPSAALARAWRRSASRVRRVALAVPDDMVWQQVMAMDGRLHGEDLHFQIGLRLREQLPWDLVQVSWDYAWHDAPNNHAASYTVCAVPLSDLQPMLDWVRGANLMPWVVDVQAQALQRWSEHVQRLEPASANAQSSPLAMGLALRRFVA
ncbi:MAG: Type pilus assembly protein PilM [Pseudomonadota bacterium]|jgi:Tfp pilus assembly PilM family ATPase